MEQTTPVKTQSNVKAVLMAVSTFCFMGSLGISAELHTSELEAIEQTRMFVSGSLVGLLAVALIASKLYCSEDS